ncbi:MAG: peptidoglycan DD-metalloendopeptidase family protein [Microscillaceae bacterium]|nr:peptidoglycan DD-metalloendopeptidase family protein [Microscillaceae bacterium]
MRKSRVVNSAQVLLCLSRKWKLAALSLLLPLWLIQAQHSGQDLKKQRSTQLWKIKKNQKLLSEIHLLKKNNLSELNLIREQIRSQKKLLDVIQQEISLLDQEISGIDAQTKKLEKDLSLLQEEYAHMIYTAAKSSSSLNHLNFVFASDSFNQFYRRLRYLQQYKRARETQVSHIQELNNKLAAQKKKVNDAKAQKENMLREKTLERQTLGSLEVEKTRVLGSLASQEKDISSELGQSKEQLARLERMITDYVGSSGQSKNTQTPVKNKENIYLSQNFVSNKGRLPWPVTQGFIASPFGKHEHPLLKDVMVDNAGVDIQTSKGQNVRAVFGGKVSTIATIPGMGGQVLMLEHGEYFTVYARVENILVSPGDQVKTQQTMASVFTDNQGNSLLQFQIWKSSEKLNPQTWLRKQP